MGELLPLLELVDPDTGRCVSLVNNCETISYLTGAYGAAELAECSECCPVCDDRDYAPDPVNGGAWWANSSDPAANDFYGLLADTIYLEPSTSIRRRGETTADRPAWSPRQLTIEGRLLAGGLEALYLGQTSITEIIAGACTPCDGWEASTRVHCPEYPVDPDDIIPLSLWEPDDPPPLVEGDECDPCGTVDPAWTPNLLAPPLTPGPTSIDSGRRNLMRLRFVYMDDIDPPEGRATPVAGCPSVQWVRLVFEVLDDFEWGDPISGVCDLSRGWDDYESGYCRPHDWASCLLIPGEQSCDDPETVGSGPLVESSRNAKTRAGRYCQPLYRTVRACLTPQLPTAADVALGIDIWSGGAELRNLRVDLWPAYNNVPSPETCEGELIYRRFVPCGQLRVPYLPAQSWLTVDGRRQETWLECRGRTPTQASNYIEGWTHEVFDPQCRMWVSVTADCFHTAPDVEVHLSYHPRWS